MSDKMYINKQDDFLDQTTFTETEEYNNVLSKEIDNDIEKLYITPDINGGNVTIDGNKLLKTINLDCGIYRDYSTGKWKYTDTDDDISDSYINGDIDYSVSKLTIASTMNNTSNTTLMANIPDFDNNTNIDNKARLFFTFNNDCINYLYQIEVTNAGKVNLYKVNSDNTISTVDIDLTLDNIYVWYPIPIYNIIKSSDTKLDIYYFNYSYNLIRVSIYMDISTETISVGSKNSIYTIPEEYYYDSMWQSTLFLLNINLSPAINGIYISFNLYAPAMEFTVALYRSICLLCDDNDAITEVSNHYYDDYNNPFQIIARYSRKTNTNEQSSYSEELLCSYSYNYLILLIYENLTVKATIILNISASVGREIGFSIFNAYHPINNIICISNNVFIYTKNTIYYLKSEMVNENSFISTGEVIAIHNDSSYQYQYITNEYKDQNSRYDNIKFLSYSNKIWNLVSIAVPVYLDISILKDHSNRASEYITTKSQYMLDNMPIATADKKGACSSDDYSLLHNTLEGNYVGKIDETYTGLTSNDIVDNLTSTNTDKMLSANQGYVLYHNIYTNTLTEDDVLNTYYTNDKYKVISAAYGNSIYTLLSNDYNGITIIDNLTSTSTINLLSANQGYVLYNLILAKISNDDLSTLAQLDEYGKLKDSIFDTSQCMHILTYPTLESFPEEGIYNAIYISEDTNIPYRWSGTEYIVSSSIIVLGETSESAYSGDRGKIAYEHTFVEHATVTDATAVRYSTNNGYLYINDIDTAIYIHPEGTNPHGLTKLDLALDKVTNVKGVPVANLYTLTDDEKKYAKNNMGLYDGEYTFIENNTNAVQNSVLASTLSILRSYLT